MSEDLFHGARFDEVIGLINVVSSHEDANWRMVNGQYLAEGNIMGVALRVRQLFHDKGLTQIMLSGNGWTIRFNVTKQRPRNLPDIIPSWQKVEVVMPANHRDPKGESRKFLCLHTPYVISGDHFQKEMALLRMFSTEW